MNYINDLKAKFVQYGFYGFILYALLTFLRLFGIHYERYLFLKMPIDLKKNNAIWENYKLKNIKKLKLDDFKLADPLVFNKTKLDLYKKRFNEGEFHFYGVFEDDVLIYSCGLSLKYFNFSGSTKKYYLDSDEAIMIDAHCHPGFRGRGLHGAMNSFRVLKASDFGKTKICAVVYFLNIPAIKSQLKVGYKESISLYRLRIWGFEFSNFGQKINYYAN